MPFVHVSACVCSGLCFFTRIFAKQTGCKVLCIFFYDFWVFYIYLAHTFFGVAVSDIICFYSIFPNIRLYSLRSSFSFHSRFLFPSCCHVLGIVVVCATGISGRGVKLAPGKHRMSIGMAAQLMFSVLWAHQVCINRGGGAVCWLSWIEVAEKETQVLCVKSLVCVRWISKLTSRV